MIFGVGVDLTSISRFQSLKQSEKFIKRILTTNEINDFNLLKEARKADFLAKRWAAKEAVSKALGCGIGRPFYKSLFKFSSIEVLKNTEGGPVVNVLDSQISAYIGKIFLSFTNEKDIVCCFVTVEASASLSNIK